MTVTLTPKHKLKSHATYQLTASAAGLTDLNGNPLAGGNFTTTLGAPIKQPKGH
jgi:hypothetical protein